jgi:lysozyme family protein
MFDFATAFARVVGTEGKYSNDPHDSGGETMYGITKVVARRHGYSGEMRDMPLSVAETIYKSDYWDAIPADVPDILRFQMFDLSVNSGVSTSVRKLQAALDIADDGDWGPISRAALAAADPIVVLFRFNAERLDFYTRLSNWSTFSRGWSRRIATDLRYAAIDIQSR